MSRPTISPVDGTEFTRPMTNEDREADVTMDLRLCAGPSGALAGRADSGFVVEWQLRPLADYCEPVKRSRAEKPASMRLVELGWQG